MNLAFSLFNVITFKNEPCQSSSTTPSSGPRNGTCYTNDGKLQNMYFANKFNQP